MDYLTVTREEYTTQICNMVCPSIYEGFCSLYEDAKSLANDDQILRLFQGLLKKIPTWSQATIETETDRIRHSSQGYDILDDLLKAVIKSNIILLTNTSPSYSFKLLDEKVYMDAKLEDFVHRCYIEAAREIWTNPFLFYDGYEIEAIVQNRAKAQESIKGSIKQAIRKMLPQRNIIKEYLKNNYQDVEDDIGTTISDAEINNLRQLVNRDLNGATAGPKGESSETHIKHNLYPATQVKDLEEANEAAADEVDDDQINTVALIDTLRQKLNQVEGEIKGDNQSSELMPLRLSSEKGADNLNDNQVQFSNAVDIFPAEKPIPKNSQEMDLQGPLTVPAPPVAATPSWAKPIGPVAAAPGPGAGQNVDSPAIPKPNPIIPPVTVGQSMPGPLTLAEMGQQGGEPAEESVKKMTVTVDASKDKYGILKNSIHQNVSESESSISYLNKNDDEGDFESVYKNTPDTGSVSNVFIPQEDQDVSEDPEEAKKRKYFAQYTKLWERA